MKSALQKITAFITSAFVYGTVVVPAFAQSVSLCPTTSDFGALCSKSFDAASLMYFIVTLLLITAVVLSLVFLIWGGIKWILSGGDKAKVEGARSTIIGALIGLAVSFAAFFLINIVITIFLGGQGLKGFNLPTL